MHACIAFRMDRYLLFGPRNKAEFVFLVFLRIEVIVVGVLRRELFPTKLAVRLSAVLNGRSSCLRHTVELVNIESAITSRNCCTFPSKSLSEMGGKLAT